MVSHHPSWPGSVLVQITLYVVTCSFLYLSTSSPIYSHMQCSLKSLCWKLQTKLFLFENGGVVDEAVHASDSRATRRFGGLGWSSPVVQVCFIAALISLVLFSSYVWFWFLFPFPFFLAHSRKALISLSLSLLLPFYLTPRPKAKWWHVPWSTWDDHLTLGLSSKFSHPCNLIEARDKIALRWAWAHAECISYKFITITYRTTFPSLHLSLSLSLSLFSQSLSPLSISIYLSISLSLLSLPPPPSLSLSLSSLSLSLSLSSLSLLLFLSLLSLLSHLYLSLFLSISLSFSLSLPFSELNDLLSTLFFFLSSFMLSFTTKTSQ